MHGNSKVVTTLLYAFAKVDIIPAESVAFRNVIFYKNKGTSVNRLCNSGLIFIK